MSGFTSITRVLLPITLAHRTQRFLQEAGLKAYEAVALWVGKASTPTFEIEGVAFPQQKAFRTPTGLLYTVDEDELHRLNVWLFENQLSLIAQIHSHPREAYHSSTDNAFPIATTAGCFSLVVPNFAQGPFDLLSCAVYRLSPSGRWNELSEGEILNIFTLTGEE